MIKSYNTLLEEKIAHKQKLVTMSIVLLLSIFTFGSIGYAFKFQIQDFVSKNVSTKILERDNTSEEDTSNNTENTASENSTNEVDQVSTGNGTGVSDSVAENAPSSENIVPSSSIVEADSDSSSSSNGGSGGSSGGVSDSGESSNNVNCNTNSVWQTLESCGWPGPSNTGPSGSLTLYSSGMTINSSGVYANLDIKGYLNINASNVTVRNFKLNSVISGYTALRIDPSVTNVILEDCEINPDFVTQFAIWGYDGITVRRCELFRAGNAIQARQNLVFEENYCHDIDDVANDGDNWHTNCVIAVNDSRGVSDWRLYHNTMRLGTPGGLKYYSGVINTLLAANNTIENNLIANGSYVMYLFDNRSASVTPTNTQVKNNSFSNVDSTKIGTYGIWYTGQGWDQYNSSVSFSGNKVLETGVSVDAIEP